MLSGNPISQRAHVRHCNTEAGSAPVCIDAMVRGGAQQAVAADGDFAVLLLGKTFWTKQHK